MRNLYLYPGDDLQPLESGEGYKDYLISEVLSGNGYELIGIEIGFELEMREADVYRPCIYITLRRKQQDEAGGFALLYPLKLVYGREDNLLNGIFDDVIVRYIYDGDVVSNFFWISLMRDGKTVYDCNRSRLM